MSKEEFESIIRRKISENNKANKSAYEEISLSDYYETEGARKVLISIIREIKQWKKD